MSRKKKPVVEDSAGEGERIKTGEETIDARTVALMAPVIPIEGDVYDVECVTCASKYKTFQDALKAHSSESIATHRIKPINTQPLPTGKVERSNVDMGDAGGIPINSASHNVNDLSGVIDTLRKMNPALINPDAVELTRGMEEVKRLDESVRRSSVKPSTFPKSVPSFEEAEKMLSGKLKAYAVHAPNCRMPDVNVVQGRDVITIACETCKGVLTLNRV